MHERIFTRWKGAAVAIAALFLIPWAAGAQSVSGQATAVRAAVLGATTALAGTGSLSGPGDALAASLLSGGIPTLGSVESLSASTISSVSTWAPPDEVSSQASVANLAITVANVLITSDFLLSQVMAPVGGVPSASSMIGNLVVGGIPVSASGAPNQVVSVPGLRVVINEVISGASGTTVNALHVTSLNGLVDVVVASAMAGISTASSSSSPPLGGTGLIPTLGGL
jgi:hypothetical protein